MTRQRNSGVPKRVDHAIEAVDALSGTLRQLAKARWNRNHTWHDAFEHRSAFRHGPVSGKKLQGAIRVVNRFPWIPAVWILMRGFWISTHHRRPFRRADQRGL